MHVCAYISMYICKTYTLMNETCIWMWADIICLNVIVIIFLLFMFVLLRCSLFLFFFISSIREKYLYMYVQMIIRNIVFIFDLFVANVNPCLRFVCLFADKLNTINLNIIETVLLYEILIFNDNNNNISIVSF